LGGVCENLIYINHEILFDRASRTLNLSNPDLQKAMLTFCVDNRIQVLVLDNLSTLVSGVVENKAEDWEIIQPWLLDLRRHHITVIFVHHAGRNNQMWGNSKREDPVFWIIRLDEIKKIDGELGADFTARFTKCRNTASVPEPYEFHFKPCGNRIQITYKQANLLDVFVQHVNDGIERNAEMAEELGVSKGYVSKLAKKAEKQKLIRINGLKFAPITDDNPE
jgi:hypothetical protein